MYNVIFYEDKNGKCELVDMFHNLREKSKTSKNAKVNLNKMVAYIDLLCEYGTRIGAPVTKHLNGDIWELRPLKNRILYAWYEKDTFILLHHFVKKTRKTPVNEIETAKKKLKDYRERNM